METIEEEEEVTVEEGPYQMRDLGEAINESSQSESQSERFRSPTRSERNETFVVPGKDVQVTPRQQRLKRLKTFVIVSSTSSSSSASSTSSKRKKTQKDREEDEIIELTEQPRYLFRPENFKIILYSVQNVWLRTAVAAIALVPTTKKFQAKKNFQTKYKRQFSNKSMI